MSRRPARLAPHSSPAGPCSADEEGPATAATLGGLASADGGFWSIQAGGLLAPLFHAAALAWRDMRTVMRWVMLRDLSEAAEILKGARDRSPGTRTAWELLGGAARTAPNELSGYWGSAEPGAAGPADRGLAHRDPLPTEIKEARYGLARVMRARSAVPCRPWCWPWTRR